MKMLNKLGLGNGISNGLKGFIYVTSFPYLIYLLYHILNYFSINRKDGEMARKLPFPRLKGFSESERNARCPASQGPD